MAYYEKQWPNPLAWPVYLTNLGYVLLGVFSICDCLVTVYVHVKRPDILSGEYQKIELINKALKNVHKARLIIEEIHRQFVLNINYLNFKKKKKKWNERLCYFIKLLNISRKVYLN